MNRFDVKNIKQRKTTKVIKLRWSAWIRRQNEQKFWVTSQTIQNNANLQRLSKYNELHRFDVKTIKYVELRPKPFQTTQTYKSNQITMNWIDLTSKRSKMLSYVPNHSKHSKTTKVIKLRWSAWIWRQNEQKCWVSRKPFKTTQMYKGYQSTMNCIDLTLKRSKMLCYVPNHSKHRKTTKVIKLRWIASIWRQNDEKCWVTSQTIPNNAKLQKWSNYEEVHGLDVKTNKNDELRRKPFKTTQIYKSDQITRKCMDLTSKRTKMLSYVPNHSKQRKSTKFIKVQWIASIWCQNDQKCWVTSQTIPNTAKLQKWSNCDEVHGFDVKTNKNVELVANHSKQRKSTKVIKVQWIASIWCQNDKKCWVTFQTIRYSKTTKVIKLRWIASIWRKNDQKCCVTSQTIPNTEKPQKWSNYDELHRFDVKTIKNVELRPKPFQTQQNYKSDQITMNWIDLTSKRSKMLSYVPNHSKHSKTTKVIKLRWIGSIWRQNDKKCWVTSQTIQNNSNLQK